MNYGISLSDGTVKNIEFIKDAQISNVKLIWLPKHSIFKDKHFSPQPSQGPRIRVASHDVMSRRQEGFFYLERGEFKSGAQSCKQYQLLFPKSVYLPVPHEGS